MENIKFDQDEDEAHAMQLEEELRGWVSPLLLAVMLGYAFAVYKRFGYKPTITCVNRSKEQNEAVDGYKFSGHLTGYALDLRDRDMSQIILNWTLAWFNRYWNKRFIYVIHHNHHIHVGVYRKDQDVDYSRYAEARRQLS